MKLAAIGVLSIVLIFLGVRTYSFVSQEQQLGSDLANIQANLTKAQNQEAELQREKAYLSNPVNLEKELRARYNYKKPGETMVIIVPAANTTTSSTR